LKSLIGWESHPQILVRRPNFCSVRKLPAHGFAMKSAKLRVIRGLSFCDGGRSDGVQHPRISQIDADFPNVEP
ncbi:MAG: hypothetical protein WD066_19705, partial [Planctomycetaceae bacterium]